jgi:23S rRNA (cytidine1920-2'-O)/16S rRNA (cytidine1409-2'-O)-methyltransferase
MRLDQFLVLQNTVSTRSQAESYIKLGKVTVDGRVITKPGYFVADSAVVKLKSEQYVSRAGLKLASVAALLHLVFNEKAVLDVGSSTGGFTDYALQHGAQKVIAVDVGTKQMHPRLRLDPRIELHEQTDIRDVHSLSTVVDIVLIDVSFISLREILPHLVSIVGSKTDVIAMVKPQFEAGYSAKNRGVIKNDRMRRDILKDFELWTRAYFVILDQADSEVSGEKGNRERFYRLCPIVSAKH